MGKRLFTKLFLAVAVLTAVFAVANLSGIGRPVYAEEKSLASGLCYEIYGDHIVITGYEGNASSLVIPDTIEGYAVTEISSYAFADNSRLTDISFPAYLQKIGRSAFFKCSGLTSLVIPDSVGTIDESAFYGCTGVKKLVLPKYMETISYSSFSNMTALSEVTIPLGVRQIGINAFSGCKGLKSIHIPKNVVKISEDAFVSCSGLENITVDSENKVYTSGTNANAIIDRATKTLFAGCRNTIIPKDVRKLSYAFYGCSGLSKIFVPASVTEISYNAFAGCSGLSGIVVDKNNPVYTSGENANAVIEKKTNTLIAGCKKTIIPNGIAAIGNYAFYMCGSLTEIIIPKSVSSIGIGAFADCSGLKNITISKGVKEIKESAFRCCSGLKKIELPDSVAKIGFNVFYGCNGLTLLVSSPERIALVKDLLNDSKVSVLCRQDIVVKTNRVNLIPKGRAVVSVSGNKTPVKYISLDKTVATVDAKGNVTAIRPGRAQIKVQASANSVYDAAEKTVIYNVLPSANYTGMIKLGNVWYYFADGKYDRTYTGMAKNKYGWWYMKNGKLDLTYTGMAKNQYGWWYMTNGKLNTKYTGMAKNQYGWWYMTNGKLNTKYTGIATNKYGKWKFVNGKLVGKAR